MSDVPLVSVVIPAYNRPEMLQEALENVLEQTYETFEVIVVDDGSPTSLEPVVADVDDERINYTRFDENQGANVARNEGIRQASGEYIAFLDDDDRWLPGKLEKQVELLEQSATADIAYTGQQFINEDGKETLRWVPTEQGDLRKYLFKGGSIGTFSCLIVQKNIIQKAGFPDPELPVLQDYEWQLRLSQYAEFVPLEEPATIRRIGNYERITDNFEQLRDVTLPILLKKHTSFAEELGCRCKLAFHAHLYNLVGTRAMRAGNYWDARKYLLRSFLYNPASSKTAFRLLIAIGGKPVYVVGKRVLYFYRQRFS